MARAALLLALGCACGREPDASPRAPQPSPPMDPRAPAPSATTPVDHDRFVEALSFVRRAPTRQELEALDARARERLLRLVGDLAAPPLARQRALSALAEWPQDDAIATLFEGVLRDPNAPIARRVRMLRLLAESHAERAVPALAWAACQPDARLLAGARRALERLPAPRRAPVQEALARCAGGA